MVAKGSGDNMVGLNTIHGTWLVGTKMWKEVAVKILPKKSQRNEITPYLTTTYRGAGVVVGCWMVNFQETCT
jgi:hypothetical protein